MPPGEDHPGGPTAASASDLILSEARLRRAQRVARLGSWELDLSTRTMWGSEEAFAIYGLAPPPGRELPLALVQSMPLPEFRPVLDRALADLLAGTRPYDVRFRIRRHGDGAVRAVHSFADVHRDEAGLPRLVTGTVQDVTEQEARDLVLITELKASEERARLAFEQAADPIVIGSQAGDFLIVNERALALTGFTRAELLAGNMRMLFDPAVLQASPLQYQRVLAGETVTNERLLTRKDGTRVAVEMHTCRLSNGTLQAIMRDVSERRRLEEELQLRQRLDSVGALASGIAHDFNNILVGIMGFAGLLRADAARLSAEQREGLDAILQSCRRAADLVQGLQVASREAPGETGSFDLGPVAAEVCAVLKETTDRIVEKELRIPPGRFVVRGDPSALFHALMNVLVNAVQAIEQKGSGPGDRVVLDAADHLAEPGNRLGLRPGRWVRVSVSDTGAGMTEEVRRRAFDPLFTTKEKGVRKGQGLGLAMVYNVVVRQHGGAIAVESAVGEGAIFHLYLPAGAALAPAEPAPPAVPSRGTESILVVEDEELVARVFRRVLERAGYRVRVAADGVEALEAFGPAGEGIDLVLLDRTLPRLRGEQVLQRMRAARPDALVIISTGDAAVELADFPGAAAVLQKPFPAEQLCALIRQVLDDGAGARAAPPAP
jgi:two-component system cell cycle sensor histidine kinase/response regulator CckA